MQTELIVLIVLFVIALPGGINILHQVAFGFKKTNLNDKYVWGIYVQGCFYAASVAAGLLMVISGMILLDIKGVSQLLHAGSIIAFALLLASQMLLGIDLGKPTRALLMLGSKNLRSPLTWDFYTMGLSTVLSLIYLLGILPANRGVMVGWALLCIIAGSLCLAAHTMFFLSRQKAGYQTNAFSGMEALLSSLLAGAAVLSLTMMAYGVINQIKGLLLILAILLLAASLAHMISLLTHESHAANKAVLTINVIVIILLAIDQAAFENNLLLAAAAVLSLVLVFIEKFIAVILSQSENIIPAPYSQFHDRAPYKPSLKEINVVVGCFAACGFIGYGIYWVTTGLL